MALVGHGGPRLVAGARCLARAAACAAVALCAAVASADDVSLRLRIEWGTDAPRRHELRIEADDGALSDPQALGIEADTPGSMWIEGDCLRVRERSPRVYDGVDVTVTAPADSVLRIVPEGELAVAVTTLELPLAGVTQAVQELHWGEGEARLLVRRAPGDVLRVAFERTSLVFDSGETFELSVEPYAPAARTGTRLRLEAQLRASGEEESLWSQGTDVTVGESPSLGEVPLAVELPEAEGVYNLNLVLTTRGRLGLRQEVAARKVQLLVLAAAPPPSPELDLPPTLVTEIDPARPGWWKRLGNVPLLAGFRQGSLGHGPTGTTQLDDALLLRLGPAADADDLTWQAYPLPLKNAGQPHVLEIELPAGAAETLGISIVEPNAVGTVAPIGLDSGVYTVDDGSPAAGLLRHRLTFWPRTRTPVVLLTNHRPDRSAAYGKLRAWSVPGGHLAPLEVPGADDAGRLLAAYYDRPHFPENFSAPEAIDAADDRALDDWNTFYQGGVRLIEHLQASGANVLMLSVLADGSTIYPSALLAGTPRHDTGALWSTAQDPVRKDVLEMLFRLCDRQGLRLVPVLHFTAPLPALEEQLRTAGRQAVGLEWIDAAGQPWLAGRSPTRGLAPYYNPLDPRVAEAMLAVISELTDRYAAHESFAGLGVQLSAAGYAQLPGPRWGFDDRTLASFERDTRAEVPGDGPTRFAARAQHLTGEARPAWTSWRAERLTALFRAVEERVVAAHPDARLFLLGTGLLDDADLEHDWRPALPRPAPLDRALLEIGLDPALAAGSQATVLLRPQRLAPPGWPADDAVDDDFNESLEVDRWFREMPAPGALFFHEPQETRLESFDRLSPFGETYTWLLAQMSPAAAENRRRFVHALAALDAQLLADGGWLLPLGQEESLASLVRVYRRLPAVAFEKSDLPLGPVTVRTHVADGHTWVYAVNDSPWPVTVELHVASQRAARVEDLSGRDRWPDSVGGRSESVLHLELAPYDLEGARIAAPDLRFTAGEIRIDEDVAPGLESRIAALQQRAAALARPSPLTVLSNPGFEQATSGKGVTGWVLPADPQSASLDEEGAAHEGQRSLRLASDGPVVTLASEPFAPPRTGRLSIVAYLRVADPQRQPKLRLAVEGRLDGREYYRHAPVGAASPRFPIGREWAQFVFSLPDLPSHRLSDLRVRFDLMGEGEVWIDDVQLFDLVFSGKERRELDTRIVAVAHVKLQQGELADCRRILEGYWPRFLEAHVDAEPAATAETASEPEVEPPPREARQPSWWDRLKASLPEPLRY
jgi:hypothetical protein